MTSDDQKVSHEDIFEWIVAQKEKSGRRPFFIGLSAPQGAGKTALSKRLLDLAEKRGLRAIAVSIDDFYLTREAQITLAEKHSQNPYLQARGYPLTHDVELGTKVLHALSAAEEVMIPRYDKSAFGGKGDRLPSDKWTLVREAQDIVILEGWMLGFRAVDNSKLPNEHFVRINQALHSYDQWLRELDAFIWLEASDVNDVVDWRISAEKTMTPLEVRRYIESFLPAYRTYVPHFDETKPLLHLRINRDRSLTRPNL